jgi:hypothetical protein
MSQPSPDKTEAIALIIDTSSSAASDLDEARRTALNINYMGLELFKPFMLGSTTPILPETLKQPVPPGVSQQTQACSLIAPIMEKLVREEQKYFVMIVGSGEIFDLDDWIDNPRVEGWLLVCTGEQSLQGPAGRLSEITSAQIPDDVDTLLGYFSRSTRQPEGTTRRSYDPGAYEWKVDASGYPLIYVDPLEAFVQLFPVTKPQFEKFMADGRRQGLDDEWYSEILSLNTRASYRSQEVVMRERLFMTGITTDEAVSFSRWLGGDYTLLKAEEWRMCYDWFAKKPAPSAPLDLAERLARDALAIWNIVEGQWLEQRRELNLQELSLMTQGILEWVIERPGRYCGVGEPSTSKFQRKADDPVRPLGPEPRRLKNLGFRLRTR